MRKRWNVGLFTYGSHKRNYPLNGCLLVHAAIRDGLEAHPDLEVTDYSPPLRGHEIDRAATARLFEHVHSGLDAVVVQATIAQAVLEKSAQICPEALRVLHRDSSHARWHQRALKAEADRWELTGFRGYTEAVVKRETAEYELADRITVASRQALSTFKAESCSHVVNVGPQVIDLARWRPSPRRWRRGKQPFLFLGQLGLRKGLLDLLQAWKLAGAPGLLLVGGIPAQPGTADEMLRRVKDSPRTQYLGGVEFKRLPELYRRVAAVVQPSIEEGASMVPHEASACALGVITTPRAGCDILRDGETGQLVPPGDPDALAAAILRYAEDDGLRYRHGLAASKAAQACGIEAYGRRYSARVRELLR